MVNLIGRFILTACFAAPLFAQDPTGIFEAQITDPSGGTVSGAEVVVRNKQTDFRATQTSVRGSVQFSYLPVGEYEVQVNARGFAAFATNGVSIDIGRTVRIPVHLQVGSPTTVVVVAGTGIDLGTSLGNVVTARDATELPLNGRDATQLGLLQPGVAPMTSGLAEAGGVLRAGQAYAVNGQRPESNNYLLDGVSNVNNVDGGYALRIPVDAIAEFRILTSNAPAEYGDTSGATTSVVTKSGTNRFHGDVYDFLRNDALDARNFFATATEPLHRNQYGATFGGPIRRDRDFFFVYYEGQRDHEGETRTAIVPTPAERGGDFSGLIDPQTGQHVPLINYFSGQPVPGSQIPVSMLNPVALNAEKLYPLGNISPSLYSATLMATHNYDQGGARLDHIFANGDQLFVRYSASQSNRIDPLPIDGSGVPGFPVGDDTRTQSVTASDTHLLSPRVINTFRAAFFRNVFLVDERMNTTPGSDLGFTYQPTLAAAAGSPYLIVSGYASVGNPITGPRDTYQNTYQASDSVSWTHGTHSTKFGVEFSRNQINLLYGIATNGFFVFAPFPFSDSFASFLTGQSVTFFQGGGQFDRGLRNHVLAGYAQDEWRVIPRLTLTYGVRYEINTPYTDIRNRMNAWEPGVQSRIYPNAPEGLLFPGDPGIPDGIAQVFHKGFMPRIGVAWDPKGDGKTSVRAGYGIFYDSFTNGVGGPLQAPVSALPWTEAYQLPGPGFNIANPYGSSAPPFVNQTFVQPATVLTIDRAMRPPYAQNWYVGVQRVLGSNYLLDVRYVGNKGTRLPRLVEGDPTVNGSRIYGGCPASGAPCNFASVGLISDEANSEYDALQVAISRRYSNGLSFLASYWYSKSLDDVSSFNVSGSAPTDVAGENDLAQNPFDLRAEHGLSLFDARNRLALSGTYELPRWRGANRAMSWLVNGWQWNGIANFSTGTPFTVYDSANVSGQGSAPEITGFTSDRPNLIANPNDGPHTPNQWVSRTAFQRLNPTTQAGQFGNEGRNVVRGPGYASVDTSLFKNFAVTENTRVQFRAECFNIANHANFHLPENDIASPEFGQVLEANPPRLLQMALKVIF